MQRRKPGCFTGKVTEIVDGDTIDVNNVRIRLSMVDAPDIEEAGYDEAYRNCRIAKIDIKIEYYSRIDTYNHFSEYTDV